jgi:hypothetical protein
MGMFSKSSFFHSSVRKEQADRHETWRRNYERQNHPERFEPVAVPVEHLLTDTEIRIKAQEKLQSEGINTPNISDPKLCDPDPKKILNHGLQKAAETSLQCWKEHEEAFKQGGDIKDIDTRDCGSKSVGGFFVGMWDNYFTSQQEKKECLFNRDRQYQQDKHQYEQKVIETMKEIPKTETILQYIPDTDPRHPYNQNPVNRPEPKNWGVTFYSDGHTHGGGINWRF